MIFALISLNDPPLLSLERNDLKNAWISVAERMKMSNSNSIGFYRSVLLGEKLRNCLAL